MLDLFHLNETTLGRVLRTAMSRGGDFADLFAETTVSSSLVQEEGILKTASCDLAKGVGIRVVSGEKTGYAYTERFSESQFLHAARTAAAIAEGTGGEEAWNATRLDLPSFYAVPDPPATADMAHKISLIQLADSTARATSDKVTKVTVSLSDSFSQVLMADSRGRLCQDEQPMIRFSVSIIAEDKGQRQEGRSGDGGRWGLSFLTPERVLELAREAVQEALTLLEARSAPAGCLPVVLAAGDSGILLHEAIGHPLEADFNRKGSSAYTGRMGEQVASPLCTIVDDGTVPHDRGSLNVDDELNASQRTVLIEQGRLVSYMYDELSARFFKVPSSGNGRRESYSYQPLPRMRTTYMLPGEHEAEEIIASVSKGIFCRTFKGGQVDISNGNFIFVPSLAWLIEDGRLSHPVRNLSLIGNGPDILSRVNMVGNDFRLSAGIWTCGKGQSVPVGVGLPTVKISEMTVGGQQE